MADFIKGIPNTHLFLFAGGLLAAVSILVGLKIRDRRKRKNRDKFSDFDE